MLDKLWLVVGRVIRKGCRFASLTDPFQRANDQFDCVRCWPPQRARCPSSNGA